MNSTTGAAPEIVMYSTTRCGYCLRARSLLEGKGVAVREVKIDEDPKERDIMLARTGGKRTVPQIFIGDRHVGGYDDLAALDRAGALESLLAADRSSAPLSLGREFDMHNYQARVAWSRNGAAFSDNRYSRVHEWFFDGGAKVVASSSPSVVPAPYSSAEAVDPEEALVASASSCHMLWFLRIAAKRGYVVERYVDDAVGVMEKDAAGKMAITRITLRPRIEFARGNAPSAEQMESLHHDAHEECFIASSLKSAIVVDSLQ